MQLGKVNRLTAARQTQNGFYLSNSDGKEVLLPNSWVPANLKIDDELDVFLYTDSEDRPIATTLTPKIMLGQFAMLTVKDVNKVGAFVDWGLPKDLLIPYAEQSQKLRRGHQCMVFLILDEQTGRLIGSTRIRNYLSNSDIPYQENDPVRIRIYEYSDLGYHAIVEETYAGLVFHSDVHRAIELGSIYDAYIKQVRADGKIDLVFNPVGYRQEIDQSTALLLEKLREAGGVLRLTDKSTPFQINTILGMSKKAFKRALGNLYRRRLVTLTPTAIKLTSNSAREAIKGA